MDFRKESLHLNWSRSSCLWIFYKIGLLKNFAKLTKKHLCWSHILIKFQTSVPETWSRRDSSTDVFQPMNLTKIFKNTLFYRTTLDDCFCWFLRSNQGHSFFICFFIFFIYNCKYGSYSLISSKKLKDINCLQPTWICKHQIWN